MFLLITAPLAVLDLYHSKEQTNGLQVNPPHDLLQGWSLHVEKEVHHDDIMVMSLW